MGARIRPRITSCMAPRWQSRRSLRRARAPCLRQRNHRRWIAVATSAAFLIPPLKGRDNLTPTEHDKAACDGRLSDGSTITCVRERPVLTSLSNANVGENANKENSFGGEEGA